MAPVFGYKIKQNIIIVKFNKKTFHKLVPFGNTYFNCSYFKNKYFQMYYRV